MNNSYLPLIIISIFTFLFAQNKLIFSASSAESILEDGQSVTIFKDSVKIIDQNRTLYTDLAKRYDTLDQVKLYGNIKMYENSDSLTCDELTLYQGDRKYYYATGNVNLMQNSRQITANDLFYYMEGKNIIANDSIVIKDSLRLITADSLFINYKGDILDNMVLKSNVKILNNQEIKLKQGLGNKIFQDKMQSNQVIIEFNNNEQIQLLQLSGMASTDFSVVQDSMLKGLNNITSDTISISLINEIVDKMKFKGGAIGLFEPDKSNRNISNIIKYKAEIIDYNVDTEIAYLIDNAEVIYGETYLTGGEIETSFNENIVISKTRDGISPSVSTNNEAPTFGDSMTFDLTTEMGNINNGYCGTFLAYIGS